MSGPPGSQPPDADITYYVYAGNIGPDTASSVFVTNTLPEGLTFVSILPTTGACTNDDGFIICNLGELTAGDQATLQVVVHSTTPGTYALQASVSALEMDPAPENNSASLSISIFQTVPVILTQPQSQSVSSDTNVIFTVLADGAPPLYYRWRMNGTNLPGATNSSLPLMNVNFRNYGYYSVLISNQYGNVLSDPALLGIDDDLTFRIIELRTNGLMLLNETNLTGYGRGGIGVSSNYVFVTGYGMPFGNPTSARHNVRDLTGGIRVSTALDSLACNLRSGKIYSLGNGNTPISYANSTLNFSSVNSLLELNDTTGLPNGTRINLSTSIPITSYQQGIFSGVDRIVLHGAYTSGSGYHVYNISLPSGRVTDLGILSRNYSNYSYTWAFWGLAEYFGGSVHLLYAPSYYNFVRRRVSDGSQTTVSSFDYLGYYFNSLGFSLAASRWYFSIPWESQFSSWQNTLGSAKAVYTIDPNFPNIITDPRSQQVYVTSNAVLWASFSGAGPISYQWYYYDTPIPDATNSTLQLFNVPTNYAGYYSVVAENNLGSSRSGSAYLDVISYPRILINPANANSYPGSNATFRVTADGAPPLFYQWRFNGTDLPGATAPYLTLTNLTIDQAGAYSVLVTNYYGRAVSADANLTIIVPEDDGTAFRILDLLATNSRVVDHNNASGDDRGGIAASSRYLFYTGDGNDLYSGTTVRFSLDDMSGITAFATPGYDTLVSNLRTETAYLLADGTNLLQGPYVSGAQFTSLLELNSDGTLSGRRIDLSRPIPVRGNNGSSQDQTGIFAGYDRIVIHNGVGNTVYKIALPSGEVTVLGSMNMPGHYPSENWAYWGVAEHSGGFTYLVYVGYGDYVIHRVRVPDGATTVVHAFSGLSDMACFTVSIPRKRWYFHYEGGGQFGGSSETAGYADASFYVNSGPNADHFTWTPVSSPQVATAPFLATLSARNTDNNLVTNYSGEVSLKGLASPAGTNVAISPTSVMLTNGIWSGFITVLQVNTNMYIRADDTNANYGNTTTFAVKPANDLAISVVPDPNPVALGTYLTYFVRVTNSGPLAATGVLVTNFLSTNAMTFFSVSSSQGACFYNEGAQVICDLGTVTNFADISVVVIPFKTGLITERATMGRAEADPDASNNSSFIFTSVVLPILTIGDATVTEGNTGTTNVNFVVTLNPPSTNRITVNFATTNLVTGAASSGPYADYIPTNGTLAFEPGVTNQTVAVAILGDTLFETNETFFVTLSSPVSGYIGRNQGVGTIINDDAPPTVSINDISLAEGNSGFNDAVFTVTLSGITGAQVDVGYATVNGTAFAGSDYVAKTGKITIPSQTNNLSQTISIQIIGNTNPEPNETFYVALTGITNAIGSKTLGLCTILNDDAVGVFHHFTWGAVGSNVVNTPFPVTLTAKDVSETTITSFNGTVDLSGWTPHPISNLISGDILSPYSASFNGSIGYSFSPDRDLNVTHFRHYFGTKVSIWTDDGALVVSQVVTSAPNQWLDTPLVQPVTLTAGTTYRIAAYGGGELVYYTAGNLFNFPDGALIQGWDGPGDAFPTYSEGVWGLVAMRYTISSNTPVAITPSVSGTFSQGTWSGSVTILEPAQNMFLRAQDLDGHIGDSSLFTAISDINLDLAIRQSVSATTARVGTNLSFTVIVSNAGPGTATSITLSNLLPGGLNFISSSEFSDPGWTPSVSGQLLTAILPSLDPGTNSTFTFLAQAQSAGTKTNIIVVSSPQNDTKLSNNKSEVQFVLYLDADHDGMWDDWEAFYQLNPSDPLDAYADSDGDKLTNLEEFLAGTNPRDPESCLRISSASCVGTNMQIRFWAVPNKQYVLERNDSLQAANWTTVTNLTLGTTLEIELVDPIPPNVPTRFYRLSVVPSTAP